MPVDVVARRTDMIRSRVRKLVRRGASANLTRLLAKVRPEEVSVLMVGLTEGINAVQMHSVGSPYWAPLTFIALLLAGAALSHVPNDVFGAPRGGQTLSRLS